MNLEPFGSALTTRLILPKTEVNSLELIDINGALNKRCVSMASMARPPQPLGSSSPIQPCVYCVCSGCENKNGGNVALPFNTSAAVVGLTKAPALTMNAKRPPLNKGMRLDIAEFKPKL